MGLNHLDGDIQPLTNLTLQSAGGFNIESILGDLPASTREQIGQQFGSGGAGGFGGFGQSDESERDSSHKCMFSPGFVCNSTIVPLQVGERSFNIWENKQSKLLFCSRGPGTTYMFMLQIIYVSRKHA